MKLRLIEYKGGFVAVQETELFMTSENGNVIRYIEDEVITHVNSEPVIAASKCMNLPVPIIPDLKELEIENLVGASWEKEQIGYPNGLNPTPFRIGFILGYKSNKAEFTEDDMRNIFMPGVDTDIPMSTGKFDKIFREELQSIRKTPKYIIIETETEYFNGSKWVSKLPNHFRDRLVKTRKIPILTKDNELIIKEITNA